LPVDRHGDVRDTAIGECGSAGEFDGILHMSGAHDPVVVDADIHEQLIELDVLLSMSVDQA
jgi:hypothetical protein